MTGQRARGERSTAQSGGPPRARDEVLLATADDVLAHDWAAVLVDAGLAGRRVGSAELLRSALGEREVAVVVLDLSVVPNGALELVSELEREAPGVPIVALAPAGNTAMGVQAVRAGATDFLRAPLDRAEARYVLDKVLEVTRGSDADLAPASVVQPGTTLIGRSAAMQELRRTLRRAATGIATVLVRGESGSGKELVARQIHELSPRARGPFIKVHCGALPDNLLESELFGYEKGAFTGAVARKPGRVELAEGGTLFLDEIGDITPAFQVKLLRLLQDRQYEPLGGTKTARADVRFVAATHRDLESMVKNGEFREDLFYRLSVIGIWVPPLRARRDDIEALCLHFCNTMAAANGRPGIALDVDALDRLAKHDWPGNVRQLANFIERLVVLAERPRISMAEVERELSREEGTFGFAVANGLAPVISAESTLVDLNTALQKAERRAIEKALKAAAGNRNLAARLLGISRRTLFYKLQEHGIS